jgi:hypothetical protein
MIAIAASALGSGWPEPLSRAQHAWDFTPLVATLLALVVWRFGLRREITWGAAAVAFILGLLLGTAAAGWGFLPAWGVAIVAACGVVLAAPRRRTP